MHYCAVTFEYIIATQLTTHNNTYGDLRLNFNESIATTLVATVVRVYSDYYFLLLFQSPTMRPNVANTTSAHTERIGLNGNSLPKFRSEKLTITRATAEE
jgi:hypothetical protein